MQCNDHDSGEEPLRGRFQGVCKTWLFMLCVHVQLGYTSCHFFGIAMALIIKNAYRLDKVSVENIVARISKFDGPYIMNLAFRASWRFKVEDCFKQLEEMGFGQNCCEGKSFFTRWHLPTFVPSNQDPTLEQKDVYRTYFSLSLMSKSKSK